jgi:hypothetical protein
VKIVDVTTSTLKIEPNLMDHPQCIYQRKLKVKGVYMHRTILVHSYRSLHLGHQQDDIKIPRKIFMSGP